MTDAPVQPPILVIDDDAATLDFLELFLSMSGYPVRSAATGQAGLDAATLPIAAVLLDRRLPDLDGMVVCQGLRDRLGPDVPIILLTADSELGLDATARAAGATAVLRKPFQPPVLLDHLAALVRHR